jgi:hypothetical protein
MRFDILQVTPSIATGWLARPWFRQRRLSDRTIKDYTRAFLDGRWMEPTLDPIAFTSEMELLNGQHRLRAVVKADWTGDMLVAFDVDPATFAFIDTGRRRVAQQFVTTAQASKVTTTARLVLWYYQRHPIPPRGGSALSFDNDELLTYIDTHENDLLRAVRDADGTSRSGGIPQGISASVLYIARENGADEELLRGWITGVTTGADLASNDPRLHIRNRMMRDVIRRDRTAVWQLTVRAFNAWMQGRPLTSLPYDPDAQPPLVDITGRATRAFQQRYYRARVQARRG